VKGVWVRLYNYAASGNCYKPRLLLALLQRDYERVPIDIFAGDTLTEEYARLNPARETPVLELDDGTLLTQSNAILWFLAEGTGFLPEGPARAGTGRAVAALRAGAGDERHRQRSLSHRERASTGARTGTA
jgi:glutathione S-transferase